MVEECLITKVNSDTFTVKCHNISLDCKSRGKFRNNKIKPVVGDNVLVDIEKKIIEEVLPRKNYLLRPPVANIDIALVVTSLKEPNLSLSLLDRLLSIISIHGIEPVIVLTKLDLLTKEELKKIGELVKYYNSIGIKVLDNRKPKKIKKFLKNKIVAICGQTGSGKTTLLNKLDKRLSLKTNEISLSLGRGKHTTRIVELFEIGSSYIIDTPGFSSIDINTYTLEDIKKSFREFNNIECQFKDCKHEKEKGCAIIKLVNEGKILQTRYENYLRFIKE